MAEITRSKITVPTLLEYKKSGIPLAMVTAYDATFACIVDEAEVDIILVGDSVATVMQGARNTLGVSMRQMEYHTQMVASATPKALVVGDMPFGSYQASKKEAIKNAIRLIKAGAEVIKLEGGIHLAATIAAIVSAEIPVMAHIGLTPQSYHRMGGNKIQGRTAGNAAGSKSRLLEDAQAVQDSGACAVVIEGVPSDLAQEITKQSAIPTIGIGAGIHCDGQVLVLHDILGLSARSFSFTKAFANIRGESMNAVAQYVSEVKSRSWPDDMHSFK